VSPQPSSSRLPRLAILPALFVTLCALRISTNGTLIDHWLPGWWYEAFIIGVMALVERLWPYRHAVSQSDVLVRDLLSTLVNLCITGVLVTKIMLPVLEFASQDLLGRHLVFAAQDQLGPLWLQIVEILLTLSFFRYWMHRWQHSNEFLWSLHSYHHRVKAVRASNLLVSHPIDFALRSVVILVLLTVIGFDPLALLIALPAAQIYGFFSHCGADVRSGNLNYVFVTPEVHRWHHAACVPEGHRYAVNYGVEFAFWDILFGTFYLPQKDGEAVPPPQMGHPSGLPEEPSYARLLLAPLGLNEVLAWFERALKISDSSR
jgi:sterol desaturase/sphingolipid hydroxylase (fatty acid hydroxylase superfamily)